MTLVVEGHQDARPLSAYPLLMGNQELVAGNGFMAGVMSCARVLLKTEEDEGWWLYGVQPGGIAESGATPQEVQLKFTIALRKVLYDFASRAASFEQFHDEVVAFFGEIDHEDDAEWTAALGELRRGAPIGDSYVASLERWPGELTCSVDVVRLDVSEIEYSAALNQIPNIALPIAA